MTQRDWPYAAHRLLCIDIAKQAGWNVVNDQPDQDGYIELKRGDEGCWIGSRYVERESRGIALDFVSDFKEVGEFLK